VSAFSGICNIGRKNPLTERLSAINESVDRLFLGFRKCVDAFQYHWEDDKREAAERLVNVIRRHGWSLYRFGYTKQSAATNALLSELDKEPSSADVTLLAMQEWTERMKSGQQEFEGTLNQREALDAIEKPVLLETRKQVYADLSASLNYLESMAEFNATPEMEELINTINEVITNVTTSAKARRTRRESKVESN